MIKTKIISEVVGSPEEHVNKTLDLLLTKIKEIKGVEFLSEKKFLAEKMEGKPLFSAFIEYEMGFEKFQDLVSFCFDFMPSSIEIIEPTIHTLDSTNLATMFNDLLARLHQNELFLRNMAAQIKLLKDQKEN